MKDSGLEWLGTIPENWHVIRSGRLFREVVDTGHPSLKLLSIDRFRGVIPQSDLGRKERAPEDRSAYKHIRKGELGYNLMNAFMGSIGVSPFEGILSPAYAVGRPARPLNPWYFHYLYRSPIYLIQFGRWSYGIMYERNRLYFDRFRVIPVPYPPIDEQNRIVAFLKSQDTAFRILLSNKRTLISLLNDEKRAITDRAMTIGVEPRVSLKRSTIRYLGDIPEHWELRRLKYLVRNVNDQSETKHPDEIYVALENIESWTGVLRLPEMEVKFESQVKRFRPGDILFGKLRPYLAKVARPQKPGVCVGEVLVLRPENDAVLPEFIEVKLRSTQFVDLVTSSTFGAKMPRADWDFIGNMIIAFPRDKAEQSCIISSIHQHTSRLDKVAAQIIREIELLNELRTRLIADVVTGKRDVDGVLLPKQQEVDESPLESETDRMIDDSELEPDEENLDAAE